MPSDNLSTSAVPSLPPSTARKPRRESRTSIVNDVIPPAVTSHSRSQSHVLKDGHHTASVSNDLTSFSELTEPPEGTLDQEPRGLTSDLQGGLSGLYHKFRASMGGPRDFENLSKIADQEPTASEPSTSQVPSGKASRIHSPRVSAFDGTTKMEVAMPKTSLKSAKFSLPSPGLRSPNANGPSAANLADPALTEITIHATATAKTHSRNGSSQAPEDNALSDRSTMSTNDEQNLRRVLSRADPDSRSSRQERQGHNAHTPLLPKIDTKGATTLHSRAISDTSNLDQKQKALPRSHQSPASASQDPPLTRTLSNRVDTSINHRTPINPLELLAGHDSTSAHSEGIQTDSRTVQKPTSSSIQARSVATSRPVKKIDPSKLPGFGPSRTSSTDSGLTSGTHFTGKIPRTSDFDGHREEFHHLQHHRHSNRPKSSILSKEFWMKDENARDCFRCGEPFTTFRRKHHCRSCGQIFDNKCTTLVSGSYFDMSDPVRVCKQCEIPIVSHDDDSSDYSDDNTTADLSARPRTPDFRAARYDDDNISMVSQSLEHIARTPVMSLPVRRAFDQSNRSSAVLEFDAPEHVLHRPSSSRSLRTAHSMGHKRHPSKHSHIRNVKAYHEEKVPFQRRVLDDSGDSRTSAFHRDSVIDPELRQYLSDDASDDDDDEPVLQPSHSSEKLSRSGPDSDRTTIGGLLAAMRKGRSRIGDRSIAGFLNFNRDADDAASIVSARAIEGPRGSRKRNLSVASSVHQKMTPRGTKERLHVVLPSDPDEAPASSAPRGSRMIRSASMHGLGAPSLELNRASIQHVHKMLRQLLKDADVPKVSSWEDALIPILLRATDDVDPDVQGGDDIDIRSYVKMKKIPGGRPADTSYTSGVIFTKNLALKSMPRTIARPRIAIITFALEYARSESHFMSLDPVIRQEREYLENLVSRIAALKPDVLLSQRNIAGLALELLDKARIAVVFNVKPTVLEAVSRCTHTPIHNSLDKLTLPARELGTCELFEVKTFLSEGRRKTYVYISGCPPELGCTIALRGTNREALGKIKRITDFMIYVVYNLKLETCLMRDEWALIPTNEELVRTPIVPPVSSKPPTQCDTGTDHSKKAGGAVQDTKPSPANTRTNTEDASKLEVHTEVERFDTNESNEIPEDIPVPTFYQDLADKHQTRILSASPFVKFAQPYLLMRARELERRVAYLKKLRDQDLSDSTSIDEKARVQKFTLITPEMVHSSLEGASRKVREIVHAVHDTEYDKAVYHYETQKKLWETHLSNNRNLFDPYAHQNIVVLFSIVSTDTNVPCSGPDIIAFNFYNEHEHEQDFEADCTLGQYVEDLCYRAEDLCPAETCRKKMHEHHRHYVHGEGQITVFVEPHPPKMRGLQDVILMWSTCKICGMETTVTPMSPSTWKYSFGKYLELSFWSADLHARAGGCPHDLHRDHLRYFGWKGYALRVHYDAIALLEVIVPRLRITWKVDNDLRFRNGVFTRVESRITKFMSSVKLRLKSINIDALLPESAEACRNEVDRLTKQANDDHDMLIKHLRERYSNSMHWEIIPLNRALRALQEKVIDWEDAFAEFEKNFFPSEKDIRRLATLQLKKIFLDRDVSVTSLTSGEDDTASPMLESTDEKDAGQEEPAVSQRKLSPEKTQNVLQSVMEEHIGAPPQIETPKPTSPLERTPTLPVKTDEEARRTSPDLDHLDLAVPESTPKPIVTVPVPPLEMPSKPSSPEVILHQAPHDSHETMEPITSPTDTSLEEPSAIEVNRATPIPVKSQLPTPAHPSSRRATISRPSSPLLVRAQSQPSGSLPVRKDYAPPVKQSTMSAINATHGFGSERKSFDLHHDSSDKKLSERFGIGSLKNHKLGKGHSLIPRAISTKSQSRVSNLAKHFEQLSREFEQARLKERRQRAARNRRSQVYPLAAPKAVVEVYSSVNEAVDEANDSEETLEYPDNSTEEAKEPISEAMAEPVDSDPTPGESQAESVVENEIENVEVNENETETQHSSHAPSLMEDKTDVEDDEVENIHLPDSPEDLLRLSQDDVEFKELPKHERTSLMKMLTNFWAERSSSGWKTLEYPLHPSDHIFADCDIIVREDELSSIIAFALDSADYKEMLHQVQGQGPGIKSARSSQMTGNTSEDEDLISRSLLKTTSSHLKYGFSDGSAKMLCKVFFAEQFDAMRRKCGVAERFIESMSRCAKYDSRGGKSKSLFLKTLDDRFVLKTLSRIETQSFLKFAPNYFELMSEAFYRSLPSQIAKMLGFYQIILTNPLTGVEHNWYLLVMENLFYDRVPTRIFDLKGSMRNRKIEATGERNEVLLDENMVDYIYESPLFVREHSKKLLRTSVHNDTLFLLQQYVMDYSLMVAIDEPRKELVVGIIDCIRTYTWDKKLESWIKDRGFVSTLMSAGGVMGGGGAVAGKNNRPTVTSPTQYKKRFREAMNRYVLEAPSCWQRYRPGHSEKLESRREERIEGADEGWRIS